MLSSFPPVFPVRYASFPLSLKVSITDGDPAFVLRLAWCKNHSRSVYSYLPALTPSIAVM